MTPGEKARLEANAAARAAVMAKWSDGTQVFTDEDCKYLSGSEITTLINAGRFGPEVGPDKRLRRTA